MPKPKIDTEQIGLLVETTGHVLVRDRTALTYLRVWGNRKGYSVRSTDEGVMVALEKSGIAVELKRRLKEEPAEFIFELDAKKKIYLRNLISQYNKKAAKPVCTKYLGGNEFLIYPNPANEHKKN